MKRKSAVIGCCYLLALICASFFDYLSCFVIAGAAVAAAGVLGAVRKTGLGLVAFVTGAAFGVFGIYFFTVTEPAYKLAGTEAEIHGTIIEQSFESNDTAAYVVKSSEPRLTFLLYGADKNVSKGDMVSFTGKLSRITGSVDFDSESYYFSRGILLKITAATDLSVTKPEFYPPSHHIEKYNRYIASRITSKLPGEYGAVLKGIFLGDKSGFSSDLKINVRRSGLSHMMAVSGLHLTVILHLLMAVLVKLPFFSNRFLRYSALVVMVGVLLIFYNMSVSVIRSGIMMLIYYGGDLFMRRGDTLNSLGFAMFILTAFTPYACLDIGLLMSAAGTLGIGVIAPYLMKKMKPKGFASVIEIILVSVCPYLCTIPLSIIFFKGFSLTAVLSNIVIQPVFYIAFIAMLVFAALGGMFSLPLLAAGLASRIMVWLIGLFAGFKYAYLPLEYDFLNSWLMSAVIFVIVITAVFKSGSKSYKSVLLSVCVLSAMITADEYMNYGRARLEVYSDGDGGIALFKKEETTVAVLLNDSKSTYSKLVEFMNNNFVDELTFLCIINETDNYLYKLSKINSIQTILPENLSAGDIYDISGCFTFSGGAKICRLTYGDIVVAFSKIADAEGYADIQILSGYKKTTPDISAGKIIYLNRRQETSKDNEINPYYEKTKIYFD